MAGEVLQAALSALLFVDKDRDECEGRGSSVCREM